MNARRRASDAKHPGHAPVLVGLLAANVLLWSLVALALHAWGA